MKKILLLFTIGTFTLLSCSSDDSSSANNPVEPQPVANNKLTIIAPEINQLKVKRFSVGGQNDNSPDNGMGIFSILNADLLERVEITTIDDDNEVPVTMSLNTSNDEVTLDGASKYILTVKQNEQGITVLGDLTKVDND